jgi:hypothetical protein
MDMVVHDCVSEAVNSKHAGEKLQSLPNPLSAVFKRLSGDWIIATEKGSPNTPLHTVNHLNFSGIDDFATSLSGHLQDLRDGAGCSWMFRMIPKLPTGCQGYACPFISISLFL